MVAHGTCGQATELRSWEELRFYWPDYPDEDDAYEVVSDRVFNIEEQVSARPWAEYQEWAIQEWMNGQPDMFAEDPGPPEYDEFPRGEFPPFNV
jgi:hypothetical protein